MLRIILGIAIVILVSVFVLGFFFHNDRGFTQKNSTCPSPLILDTPVSLDNVTSVLYPGQIRGGDYKRHGGFRFDNVTDNQVEVRAPIDAVLTGGSRYTEMNEVQYLLDFETDCGIKFRFDHFLTLAPKLAAVVEKLPAPKPDDSRTTNIQEKIYVKKGEVMATAVGTKNNAFVDFGVYDSKNQSPFGRPTDNPLCWFDLLTSEDASKVKALPPADSERGKESDICR